MDQELEERARKRIGTTLRDKYRIDALLGVGGMAVVYRATHRNQAEFAIKMLHAELSMRESLRQRFLREGYAANSVKHPGVVAIVDEDVADDGAAFLVMELLSGSGLDVLAKANAKRLPVPAVCAMLDQLLDVLAAAHAKGIVHRDIKPANLFLTDDRTLKVLDFGIARVRDSMTADENMTNTGVLLGTPGFMAPEQARGDQKEIDARTDLWAAAATAFKLISGKLVHGGENATQVTIATATKAPRSISTVTDIPLPIARVIDRALDFDRESRWSSATDMQRALREAVVDAYGTAPSRRVLGDFSTGSASAAHAHPTPTPAPAIRTAVSTTATPLEAFAPPPKKDGRALTVLAVVTLAIAFGVGVRALARSVARTDEPSAVVGGARPETPPMATPTMMPLEQKPVLPEVTAESQRAPSSATSKKAPPVSSLPVARTRPVAATLTSCDPPYYFDPNGNKVFKKECL